MDRDTGRSKGFGFVEMGSDPEAQAAINGMNGQALDGRAIVVNEARPREERPGGFRGGGGGGGYGGGGSGGGGGGGGGWPAAVAATAAAAPAVAAATAAAAAAAPAVAAATAAAAVAAPAAAAAAVAAATDPGLPVTTKAVQRKRTAFSHGASARWRRLARPAGEQAVEQRVRHQPQQARRRSPSARE